jgi:hypothetical protein
MGRVATATVECGLRKEVNKRPTRDRAGFEVQLWQVVWLVPALGAALLTLGLRGPAGPKVVLM